MMKKYILLAACTLGLSLSSCEDFLDYTPTAVVDEDIAFSEPEKWLMLRMLCWVTAGILIRSICSLTVM